jgi:type IV secretion system protein TrbI
MADQVDPSGTTPVVDRRPVPRGVLPRGMQTWLMAAVALGILVIVFLTGQPGGPPVARPPAPPAQTPTADRVRDYQERLRMLDEHAAREAREAGLLPTSPPSSGNTDVTGTQQVDPLVEERKRRNYESLFASNVVLSKRPDSKRPETGLTRATGGDSESAAASRQPSIDDVADAVVRASARSAGAVAQRPATDAELSSQSSPAPGTANGAAITTGPISTVGPLHRVLEGTLIDAVLTNRLDGSSASPVSCLVTNAVYSHSGQHVVIPAGARVLGETRPVQTYGESRLAVALHRLLMPDGSTVPLDRFRGLNQIGDSGLRDRVNHHYWSTFGAAGAVGLVSGLSQLLSSAGFGIGDGDRTVILAGNAADAAGQATQQVMTRFLNRLPTITIREGHRIKVYVTSDLDLPEWLPAGGPTQSVRR